MVQPAKPGQLLEKLITERCLQPGEVIGYRCCLLLPFLALPAQQIPLSLAVRQLYAPAYKITPLGSQRKVFASVERGSFAKWAISSVDHG